ncbi:hypothetical protein, partial [Nocardioides daeguensis]
GHSSHHRSFAETDPLHRPSDTPSGDLCPPEKKNPTYGAFHEIEVADAQGRYRIRGLVPGRVMIGADGWPHGGVPRCRSGLRLNGSRVIDLPLQRGGTVTGRLVYGDTRTPVITNLSYELGFTPGSRFNPTEEHPSRSRTNGDTGRFAIRGFRGGRATGFLAERSGEGINDPEFQVIFPYQDGTPYWLETEKVPLVLRAGSRRDLGDVVVTQR